MNSKISLLFIVLLNCKIGSTLILDWIWETKTVESVSVADSVPLISIPYESVTEDEKFLQEAAKFTDIQAFSPLETCQHKVVMKIKTSCSDMTEEQLAKLSVNLLNCQSAAEGRKIFPCIEDMSLKQCTTQMDADMWNAYHLMSNRARAVCYAARSTQFRALTELTVNKLMKSAHSQIETLSSLKQSQDRLEEQTVDALSSLSAGNKALLEQQQNLKNAQVTAHKLVKMNLKELNDEKALIRSGHAQLAIMAEDIKNKLEKAHKDLEQQAITRGENHQEILQDLINIQEQTQSIWEKIEFSTDRILEQHDKTIAQYEQTLQKLVQINDTIQYIWNLTMTMRTEVDQKLGWITDYIGDTGEQVQKVYRTFLHVVYILMAMLVAAFLQAPLLVRITILCIVPMNLVTYLKYGMEGSLDFLSMSVLIFLITAMHFIMLGIQRIFGPNDSKAKTESARLIYRNGHLNGDTHEYASSSYTNSLPKVRLHTRILQKIQECYNLIVSQMNLYKGKVKIFIEQLTDSWHQWSSSAREQLSCSYQPSKKKHENIIDEHDFPSMISDDLTDSSMYLSPDDNRDDDENEDFNVVDIYDIKSRPHRIDTSRSRSVTPSNMHCMGITRTGRRCRMFSSPGQNYCFRHATGNSIVGDSLDENRVYMRHLKKIR